MKYVVRGLSPEQIYHEWSGSGWADCGHGQLYDQFDAERVALDANIDGEFIAFAQPEDECRGA